MDHTELYKIRGIIQYLKGLDIRNIFHFFLSTKSVWKNIFHIH